MTESADRLESLALELRADLPEPRVDLVRQRRRLELDSRTQVAPRPWVTPALAFAIACVVLLAGFSAWRGLRPGAAPAVATPSVPSNQGHRHQDGSYVALAPGGLGRVLESSNQDLRYELVRGRADVSVVPQVGHHWSIAAGPYAITVIGTAFSVDYAEGDALLVQVEHGIVSVSGGRLAAPLRLEQGARLQVVSGNVTVDRPTPPEAASAAAPQVAAANAAPAHDAVEKKPSDDWEALYGKNDYRKAVAQAHAAGFESLVATLPEAKLSKLADAARLGGDERGARLALQSLAQRFGGSPGAARAVFLLGTLDAKSGNAAAATLAFQRYLSLAPSGPFASEATGRLMQLYSQRGQSQEARQMASSYLKREPSGPYARLAQSLTKAP